MIIREIHPEGRKLAALKVRAWGFPREVTWSEWADGVWITDEPQTGIAWLSRGVEEGHWLLHAQVAPGHGEGLLIRHPHSEVLCAIRTVAGVIGARRVYAALAQERPGWQRLLLRSGYFEKRDPLFGPYMDLEGA